MLARLLMMHTRNFERKVQMNKIALFPNRYQKQLPEGAASLVVLLHQLGAELYADSNFACYFKGLPVSIFVMK